MGRKYKQQTEEEEFNLDDVIKLGGTKEDFESLKDLKDGFRTKKKGGEDTFQDDEFKEFFKSVGFDKIDMNMDDISDVENEEVKTKPVKQNKITPKKSEVSVVSSNSDTSSKTTSKKVSKKNKEIKKKSADATVPSNSDTTSKKDQNKNKENQRTSKKSKSDSQKAITSKSAKKSGPLQDTKISSTTDETSTPPTAAGLSAKVYSNILDLAGMRPKKLILKPEGPWHNNDISKMPPSKKTLEPTDTIVIQLKNLGKKLLENEGTVCKSRSANKDSGNDEWMKTVISSGTLSDRVAAFTLMLQNAPIHNNWCLETFLGMLKKKGKREAIIGLEALRDIFLSDLLPDDRRLKSFHNQPIAHLKKIFNQETGNATSKRVGIQKHLIHWAYEDELKTSYNQLVESLRDFFLQDPLENIKTKGMKIALELLKSKPEQERELLTMLVNKLGDPKYKIASKGLHMLHSLIQEHPVMQCVIVNAVRDLLLRPNIQPKCQYYCICFLSAQILSRDRTDVADTLIQIYLGFFKAAINKKQIDNKLLSALLTGVNRAYPFSNHDDEKIVEELNVLFRTVHISSFGTSVQSLMLLFQVLSSREELSDRYYNALYSSLLHAELPICTNRHPMYLNLIFRSLKSDPSESRVQAFMKRLLQTCSLQHAAYTSAVLVLITELVRFRPSLKCYLDNKGLESKKPNTDFNGDSDEEEHFVDVDKSDEAAETNDDDNSEDKVKESKGVSWTHLHKKSNHRHSSTYDPTHRNPTFASTENTSLWELHRICCHFHPTVAKFATEIGSMASGVDSDRYPGDPLQDFTLMRFLDKFVYRNPKARQEKDNSANTGESLFRRKRKIAMAETHGVAANTPEFLNKKSYDPEELFLQRYFMNRAANAPQSDKVKKAKLDDGDDIEEISDDEFDRFLSSADGQDELNKEYNFADGAIGSKNKRQKLDLVQDSDDDEDDTNFDEIDDDGSVPDDDFADENPFDEEGMNFENPDGDEDDINMLDKEPRPKQRKGARNKKSAYADAEAFDMMLEENAQNKYNTSGSNAVRNTDRSSAKQLHWERKRETKDIVARKRAQGGRVKFSKHGGKRSKFDDKRGKKFSGKNKFHKRR